MKTPRIGVVGYPQPDIALRPLDRALIPAGKKVYKLKKRSPPTPVSYALAAGFPTAAKIELSEGGERLMLQSFHAIAEGVGSSPDSDQVQFYSEVQPSKISGDISGISGGSVFWSDGKEHGLLGFVKEAMAVQSDEAADIATVHFICQRVDYDMFTRWAICWCGRPTRRRS